MSGAHPISITPNPHHVVVRVGGEVVADTRRALNLKEGSMGPVLYIPREDAVAAMLHRTATTSHCPFKGDASYYSVEAGGRVVKDAIWTYETPLPAVAAIAGHLAFYASRVDSITETAD